MPDLRFGLSGTDGHCLEGIHCTADRILRRRTVKAPFTFYSHAGLGSKGFSSWQNFYLCAPGTLLTFSQLPKVNGNIDLVWLLWSLTFQSALAVEGRRDLRNLGFPGLQGQGISTRQSYEYLHGSCINEEWPFLSFSSESSYLLVHFLFNVSFSTSFTDNLVTKLGWDSLLFPTLRSSLLQIFPKKDDLRNYWMWPAVEIICL